MTWDAYVHAWAEIGRELFYRQFRADLHGGRYVRWPWES